MRTATPEILEFADYREYLRTYYTFKKNEGRGFSFRYFSRRVGLRSPNYLKLVMDGQRNLTAEMAERFTKALDLSGAEATYFVELVAHSQAKCDSQRQRHHNRLVALRTASEPLPPLHVEYFSLWYVQAIEARLRSVEGAMALEPLVQSMCPAVSATEARNGLRVLKALGLVAQDEAGGLVHTGKTSPDLLASVRAGMLVRR